MSRLQNWIASLAVVIGGVMFGQAVGCAELKGVLADKDTRLLIDKCVAEGREAHFEGKTPEQAAKTFDDCIARGLDAKDGGANGDR